ncbi:chitin deacetylase-like 5 isoform X2 [Anticarsia gemmatalis]|uniref:chitin deacetylase-like 5 isoform X2 n=1 Tax=Anticarsia gemmatalis TaxID=129554 RepID=UPI003F76196E
MRSFGAAALFTLAIITECYGAQSDRSRSRSGPVRSVPVAADIKRDADFDCPEEFGYYPHPTDCSLYYVCVFGGALLESCTGGLMYSHELQTCDWPRNVGCDGTSAGGEELERVIEQRPRERQPPPPPPRRTPPPPPLRAQPNPVVTSRGQPKFNRQEYEKQQQLYAEVDDLPPVEEIESDRQQRVYRGQPPTIGQVQKDRDGYGVQQISSGRNLNSNIIPASIPQNSGKIGSFSFGSQVDERRTATVTPAPQSYSEDKSDIVTDSHHDRHLDVETNEITTNDLTDKPVLRKKREVVGKDLGVNETSTTKPGEMSKRSDSGEEMEYVEIDADSDFEEALPQDDTERGKRQIRYYLKNGYKSPGKNWGYVKPVKVVEYPQTQYSSNSPRYQQQQQYNNLNNNNYYDSNRRPQQHNSNSYQSAANPFLQYQSNNFQSHVPFRPSLPDPSSQTFAHNPLNSATQIITKSPPISALNGDPYSSLAGGFYNNAPRQNINQAPSSASQNPLSYPDSSYVPSTVVTGKPVPVPTSPKTQENYRRPEQNRNNYQSQDYTAQKNQQPIRNVKPTQQYVEKRPSKDKEYDDDDESKEEDDESYEDEDEDEEEEERFKHDFKPPYEFTHPSNKYKEIENPFANPDFDFDAYLAKISNGQYSTGKPEPPHKPAPIVNPTVQVSTVSSLGSTVNYIGMSTPKPFTLPSGPGSSMMPIASSPRPSLAHLKHGHTHEQLIQRPEPTRQIQQQHLQQQSLNENVQVQHTAGTPLEAVRPKLKPPNFKDDRQLPISYSFSRPITSSTPKPYHDNKSKAEPQKTYSVTQKPFVFISSTGSPLIFSTPKHQYIVKPENIIPLKPVGSAKPYLVSSIKPHNAYIAFKQSTPKPLTTIANEQLSALQQYWNKNPTTEIVPLRSFSFQQSTPAIQKLENLFSQVIKSTQSPVKNHKIYLNNSPITTTARPPAKRRPIPKPSPEMNDYYYEDDEQYFEPAVKPKYMPSTEIKPQRPPMAQNYKEYDDSYEDDSETEHARPQSSRIPLKYKPESATKNHNDVSIATKVPLKNFNKNINGKIPIPVLVDYNSPTPNTLIRPEVSNYQIVHHMHRNRTMHIRRPVTENGPNTVKPPKYLNQTTLRPYTVRHRLAKPTTVKEPSHDGDKQTRGRVRHPNIVAQMKLTTPRDSHNQETRYTKIKHDDKTNSLEPTESVTPVQYSASPRPKMLYNGTQNYSPDQYDPFYAVYDEDGELYKDTDYVQQYNTASLRPVVQQTYRGTPPPARRPVETYTPRPSPDDYDDELIQPQINTQNQYQTPIRHSTRGEGNELGYDHNPSSVKTTLYEATTLSTTPPTTSTSTTTQRPTTAPYTEAMTPSRYTPRSSTDESPIPESSSKPSDETTSSVPTTPNSIINVSSLAKPFEKTDNSHRLRPIVLTTEKLPTAPRRSSEVTNQNNNVEVVRSKSNRNNKKVVSLTSGFSIRRNPNNTNNPYTLTVLTRPFDDFDKARRQGNQENSSRQVQSDRYYYDSSSDSKEASVEPTSESDSRYEKSSESSRRKDYGPDNSQDDDDIPVYVRPTSRSRPVKSRVRSTTLPSTTSTKYYINSDRTVTKRPAPFSVNNQEFGDSTENAINTEALIETGLQNAYNNELSSLSPNDNLSKSSPTRGYDRSRYEWNEPAVSPFKTLDNLRNAYQKENIRDYTTTTTTTTSTTTSTTQYTPTTRKRSRQRNTIKQKQRTKPSYYSYRLEDEVIPDQTTEIFNGKVKNVIKAFLNNFVSSPEPQLVEEFVTTTTTPKSTTPIQRDEEEVVNIGYQKKPVQYVDEKPLRSNVKRLQIITEPAESRFIPPTAESISFTEDDRESKDFSSTTTTMASMSSSPFTYTNMPTTPMSVQSSTNDYRSAPSRDSYQSKFSSFIASKPETEGSRKFQRIFTDRPSTESNNNRVSSYDDEQINPTQSIAEDIQITTEAEKFRPSDVESDIASTTSTTKATTTVRIEPTTSTTKSISFPTRASRVNPAIKLAATNPGGGRRSYQSSSKCSSDNSLQANPKCNEIKYQRPTSTRGRGSAHYSTASGSDSQSQPAPNRGTPPTRNRPTLKPSTAIVSENVKFSDIYTHPASRPAPVYPQPTPDKTAAKCRKDVCLLPDCYCGGKDIPGNLPVREVPQMVLITFDDAVNDLNKMYYEEIFERGRKNPNGCPITGTFYVSHEWTDYSQVQNLYADGHEFGSHTVSHSFGEQFSQKKWYREVGGQREILAAYGGVKLEDVRGMRAPFLSVGGNKMFKMLYDANFTYDSSLPVYENRPPSWPYTLDYKLFHDCMIPPCPTKSYPGVWEVPMVMWQDLNGGRCSMGDACANPPEAENVYKMILKNFDRHYTTNRAPFGLFYHAAWFTQPHHKEGFIMFLDFINQMPDVWIVTNWQALQWVRDPTPVNRLNNFQPFQCNYQDRPKKCNNPKVCNLWHKSGVRYMRTCQPCPEVYPWTGKSGIRSSRIDNDIGE